MTRLFLFLLSIGLLASCRSTRPIQTAIAKKDSISLAESLHMDSVRFMQQVLRQVDSARIPFSTFSAKVNVDYTGGDGKKYDLNTVVRMQKDSAIWISANAILGIEAIRVLVTPDSVKVLDKLNKTYMARSVDYLQEVTALPLDLRTLQDLIVGNAVFLDSNVVSYSLNESVISLLSLGPWFKNLLSVSVNDKTLQRSKLDDADASRNRTAELTYSDYENKRGPQFATKRRITIAEKNKLDIRLDFKSYEFNEEVSFPFSIPKNFTRN